MKFIEALKLKSKLFFLFILITVGLIILAVMGTININSMKKNVDSLYFGSLVPVTELNKIVQIYHGDLLNSFNSAKVYEISQSDAKKEVQTAVEKININWNNYESHFKRDEEVKYIKYVSSEINNINKFLLNVVSNNDNIENISSESLIKYISHIHDVIKKLINYETDTAKYERKKFIQKYESTILEIGLFLLAIIIVLLVILYMVFSSIQKDHSILELTTKKLKKANKKLEEVSYTDALTSLHNRRYFNYIYDKEIKRAKREENHITFMMIDIDFFKQYNDTYGHIEGDFALKSVAKVLKDTLKRPSDFVFRLGGEEFGVLLTDTNAKNSAYLAQEICNAVKNREILHEKSKVDNYLTVSIGVVACVANQDLKDELLISIADELLYEAKNSGRNRYILRSEAIEVEKEVEIEKSED